MVEVDPKLMADLHRAAISTVMMEKFGIMQGTKSEREIAETMARLPDAVIQRKINELQHQLQWLKGWLRAPPRALTEKAEAENG